MSWRDLLDTGSIRYRVNQRKLRTYTTHLYLGTSWLRRRRGQR